MEPYQYRPEIDGLRAIAVLSVVIHHLNPKLLTGGFAGVDIFFVISGYLISQQLYAQIQQQRFSFRQFYQRRINRIVPALFTMILLCSIAGYLLLSPKDFLLFSQSALAAITGLSNVFFWREYGSYFAANAAEAPLLHTWSLGVEEQFYLIWPLLVFGLLKIPKYWQQLCVLIVLTLAAIVFSELATNVAAAASFYLLPSRFFELMLGALLAMLMLKSPAPKAIVADMISLAGFAVIVASVWLLSKQNSFPGYNALWPCLGSMLLLWGVGYSRLKPLLSNRFMVFIGLISYSLYLWHWPVIAYLNYLQTEITLAVAVVVCLACTGIAWLSWRYIEVPLRQNGIAMRFTAVAGKRLILPFGLLLLFCVTAIFTDGFAKRFSQHIVELEQITQTRPNILRQHCHASSRDFAVPIDPACRLGSATATADSLLIGDSFANHFTGMADVMASAADIAIIDYTMDECPPILGYQIRLNSGYIQRCEQRNQYIYQQIAGGQYRRVILAARWPVTTETKLAITHSVRQILDSGVQLTIILANPIIKYASSCPLRQKMYNRELNCSVARTVGSGYFAELAEEFPALHFIDPSQIICDSHSCNPELDGIPLYRDNGHLNDVGSRILGKKLLAAGVGLFTAATNHGE